MVVDVRGAAQAFAQAVNTALARGSRSYPSAELAHDGYALRPGFLSEADANAIVADVERFGDRTVRTTGMGGTKLRDRADKQSRDLNVRQLVSAERLSPTIDALYSSGRVEQVMSGLTGLDLRVGGMTVQIDWPDTETKRGLHVDSHWPPTYKAFVYLTSVLEPANGPFSVVPGSHRDRVKKVKAVAGDYLHGRDHTDLDHEYSMDDARCLLGPPGTAIFADQRVAHAGWPGHTTGTRFMLVAYLYQAGVQPPRFLR
jgi:ectoine hydroxylase-related dioxygenase (phytanoyl-CoA dioxygenase family)